MKLSLWPGVVPKISVLAAALVLSGCAVSPTPFTVDEIKQINSDDRRVATAGIAPFSKPVSLEEAIARTLKYNLEHRTKLFERSLAAGQLEAGKFDMLPKLVADAGYAWRDKDGTRKSLNPTTGTVSDVGYISADKTHTSGDVALLWNILDFGASYYTAKQNADRLLIANERRRKAMHTLIQNVRTAYWRALAAQMLSERLKTTIAEAEAALEDARKVSDERVKNPTESLRYRRTLLENLRLMEGVERELASARIELASLMGASPGERIVLAEPKDMEPPKLDAPIEKMEELALTQNADLRESLYNVRIAAADTRRTLLKLLPGITFEYSYKFDDDSYLIHDQWQEAGVRVSFNLFNILSGPSQMDASERAEQVQQARRMALQMAILTQVHLVNHQYGDALRQYKRADAIYEVDGEMAKIVQSQEQTQMASRLDRISASVTFILSSVRRYQAMAKVHEAASRVQATLGLEPQIASLDDLDLPGLEKLIGDSLQKWVRADEPAQTAETLQQVEPPQSAEAAEPTKGAEPQQAVAPVQAAEPVKSDEPEQIAVADQTPLPMSVVWLRQPIDR